MRDTYSVNILRLHAFYKANLILSPQQIARIPRFWGISFL